MQRLEGETRRQLNLAVAVDLSRGNLPEVPIVLMVFGIGEYRRVEEVESIRVQFQLLLIRQMNVLLDAPVDHAVSGSNDLVASQGSQAVIHCAVQGVRGGNGG